MPNAQPTLEADGKIYSGDYLMKVGINVFTATEMTSHVVEITAQQIIHVLQILVFRMTARMAMVTDRLLFGLYRFFGCNVSSRFVPQAQDSDIR